MLTFQEFLVESSGIKAAAAVGITLKIRSLHQQVTQDRTASKVEKILSQEILWLASLAALGIVTETKANRGR